MGKRPPSIEDLKKTQDEAKWSWLKPHALRDAVILVHTSLDILDVGVEIAGDNSTKVRDWLKQGMLKKLTHAQVQAWDKTPDKRFMCMIVAPYVLAQELLMH